MINPTRFLAGLLCLAVLGCDPCCYAQLKVDVNPIKLISGLTNPTLAGPYVLIDADSKPQTVTGAIVSIGTGDKKYEVVRIDAETIPTLDPVDVVRIDSNNYLILTPGTHRVTVYASDPGFDMVKVKVKIDGKPEPPPGPGPGPGPGPKPDVQNAYNVGLPAFQNAPPGDAEHAGQYARIYREAAGFLYGIPSYKFIISDDQTNARDPNKSVSAWLDMKLGGVQCRDQATCQAWTAWRAKIGQAFAESQRAKNGYTREDWFQAFNEVALALDQVVKQ